jgi:hypothetical protein
MIPGMARSTWNVSGDTVTLEEGAKRSPSRWLRQNSLKLALLLGIAEAIFALVTGHRLLIFSVVAALLLIVLLLVMLGDLRR